MRFDFNDLAERVAGDMRGCDILSRARVFDFFVNRLFTDRVGSDFRCRDAFADEVRPDF